MFNKEVYTERRQQLRHQLHSGIILLLGNNEVGMNYAGNTYHFRQDSTFLYFFGLDVPGLAAMIDLDSGTDTIFGDDLTLDDVVWMGSQPSVQQQAESCGVRHSTPLKSLSEVVGKAVAADRQVHFLPPYRHDNMLRLNSLLGIGIADLKSGASVELIKAVVQLRSHKAPEEILEIEKAVNITGAMHISAMKGAIAGKTEAHLAGIVNGIAVSFGGQLAYGIILTTQGQTLHNHFHGNTLKNGDLVLGDFGAETGRHYAGDLTRTFPVDKTFSARQREIYQVVLDSQLAALDALKPGMPYQQVHLLAARKIAEGLTALGLMKGDPSEAVAAGAHAMFFPHGLGHMMGLDVHDMEDLGEEYVGYSDTVKRIQQFGTAYLRLGRELEPGFVLTVEPGIYFIPELIDQWQAEGRHIDFINYEKVNTYRDFGGIRIEDNVIITPAGYRIFGRPVPKTIAEVEALRG
jgi:Xaa-Pro aminopeptidase